MSRPKFGGCTWRDDCEMPGIFGKRGGTSGVCSHHRNVTDESLRPYFVTWYRIVPPCGECGERATMKQTRAHVPHFRCAAHALPVVPKPEAVRA